MPQFLRVFVLTGALFCYQNAFAVMQIDVPKSVKQGGVIKVVIRNPEGGPHEAHFYPVGWPTDKNGAKKEDIKVYAAHLGNDTQIALIPVSVFEEPGIGLLSVFSLREVYFFAIEIQEVDFLVSKKRFPVTELTPAMLKKSQKERVFLDEIYARITQRKYFSDSLLFSNPLDKMKIVFHADFGQIRKKVLVNSKMRKTENIWYDYHKGVDFFATSGTPIYAADSGKVAAARTLLGSGNTVIIDHGYGLFSLYFHLSRIYLKEGVEVRSGQKIGLVGMSGNAEGPHLHFEVRLLKIPVNPFEFLGAQQ